MRTLSLETRRDLLNNIPVESPAKTAVSGHQKASNLSLVTWSLSTCASHLRPPQPSPRQKPLALSYSPFLGILLLFVVTEPKFFSIQNSGALLPPTSCTRRSRVEPALPVPTATFILWYTSPTPNQPICVTGSQTLLYLRINWAFTNKSPDIQATLRST